MNKIKEYNDILAFHPGYYVNEIIEDMEMTQKEFAKRLGTTEKTLSKLVNGEIRLSNEIANKLSLMTGISIETWLNLQSTYDIKCLEIDTAQNTSEEIPIMKVIDYSYFQNLGLVKATKNPQEKVSSLCQCLEVASLTNLKSNNLVANFRSSHSEIKEHNIINANAWLSIATRFAKDKQVNAFNKDKLLSYINEIRSMTLQPPSIFIPRLNQIFTECGVSFILLPTLKNSNINGAVKWITPNKVILAINDRNKYADIFWFSMFHEIRHVLQMKLKTILIDGTNNICELDETLEKDADNFATNTLIPIDKYTEFIRSNSFISQEKVEQFAKDIGIHAGIVVGRLHHDSILPNSHLNHLRERYKISITIK